MFLIYNLILCKKKKKNILDHERIKKKKNHKKLNSDIN